MQQIRCPIGCARVGPGGHPGKVDGLFTPEEAFDVLEAAYTEQMVKRAGWVWLDGFNAAPFGSDVAQMAIFSGGQWPTCLLCSYSQGPLFDSYSAKWAEDVHACYGYVLTCYCPTPRNQPGHAKY
eukprot:926552-Amphidinium_carterae.1